MGKFIRWGLVVGWMAVIFYLSHQPAQESTELSVGVMEWLVAFLQWVLPSPVVASEGFHFFVRKGAHFCAYFVLGFLLLSAFRKSGVLRWRGVLFALLSAVMYAISDEVHQLFVPGRSGEVRDVIIDGVGASVGIGFYLFGMYVGRIAHDKKDEALKK